MPSKMQPVQVRLSEEQLSELDRQVKSGRYPNRSEAIRDYLRKAQLWEALEKILSLGDMEEDSEEEVAKRRERIRQEVYEEKIAPLLENQ